MNLNKVIPDFYPGPNVVHVWIIHLDGLDRVDPPWGRLLTVEEKERARKFRFKADRLRFLARRGMLRLLLTKYAGMPLEKVVYHANLHGKLSLPNSRISFNLSSSQDWVTYAFALDSDVGVDVEQVRPMPDMLRVAKHWFSLDEQIVFFNLPPRLQTEAFFHIWTQKEAFIKARGDGLAYPLKDFSVSVDPNQPARLLSIKNAPEECLAWQMLNDMFEGGWRVAVCIKMQVEPQVEWFRPSLEDFLEQVNSLDLGSV